MFYTKIGFMKMNGRNIEEFSSFQIVQLFSKNSLEHLADMRFRLLSSNKELLSLKTWANAGNWWTWNF